MAFVGLYFGAFGSFGILGPPLRLGPRDLRSAYSPHR